MGEPRPVRRGFQEQTFAELDKVADTTQCHGELLGHKRLAAATVLFMASFAPARRRVQPEPLETTTRHSDAKSRDETVTPASPTGSVTSTSHDSKRLKGEHVTFAPDVLPGVERLKLGQDQSPSLSDGREPARDENMDSPALTRRTFHAQTIETTARINKQDGQHEVAEGTQIPSPRPSPARRRFAPEMVSSSSRSHKTATEDDTLSPSQDAPSATTSPPPSSRRKFVPEVVSTSSRSNRNEPVQSSTQSPISPSQPSPKPKRRFKVDILESATRSRKAGDTSPAVRAEDKTNGTQSESFKSQRPPLNPLVPPTNTPATSSQSVPYAQLEKPNPNRQGSMHPHYTTRTNTRQHSFKVPSLEAIDSSESSPATGGSLHSRRSSLSSHNEDYKDATRLRESVDDRFSGYLLALAARAAEKQLRDQEAAVFSAADVHEPIMHYVDSEGSSNPSPEASRRPTHDARPTVKTYRRDSDDEAAAIEAMRKRGEEQSEPSPERKKSQINRRATGGAFNVEFDAEAAQDAWMAKKNAQTAPTKPKNLIGGHQRDPDLKQMRKAASPPMLGGDIDFPRCPSPEHARFDVTQGSEFLRNSICYGKGSSDGQGMWAATERKGTGLSLGSDKSSPGLWGGHCTLNDQRLSSMPMGIVTPQRSPTFDKQDPFQSLNAGAAVGTSIAGQRGAPPTPPASNHGGSSVSLTLTAASTQQDIILEREFPDVFVTQVYNYLSLGFPALAKKFDPELAKISGFDIDELRKDDKLAEQRGYLRLGEDEVDVAFPSRNMNEQDLGDAEDADMQDARAQPIKEEMCARWRALRIYVREWGRQMGVANEGGADHKYLDPHRAWGLPARKGSWGG